MSTEENSGGSEDDGDIPPGSKVDPEIAAKQLQLSNLQVESGIIQKNDVLAEVQTHLSDIIDTVVSSEGDAKLAATSRSLIAIFVWCKAWPL